MERTLRAAMQEFLDGWTDDLTVAWRRLLGGVEPDFDGIEGSLRLRDSELIFPARQGHTLAVVPPGSHVFRALDGIPPRKVRVVVIGQDPYPNPAQATGRAFEQGDLTAWARGSGLSPSLRTIIQVVATHRYGGDRYRGPGAWSRFVEDIDSGTLEVQAPDRIFDHWQRQGVLWLNTALTITRFRDPHQTKGHIPLWAPVVRRMVTGLAERGGPGPVILAWGGVAKDFLVRCGLLRPRARRYERTDLFPAVRIVERHHPQAYQFMWQPNTFSAANDALVSLGLDAVDW